MTMRKLSVEESQALYSLLKAEQSPLDEIVDEFNSKIPRSHRFTVCSFLAMLLEDKKILNYNQRLVAFTILHQAYSSQKPASNPFINFIVNAACDDKAEQFERAFVLQLIGTDASNSSKEFLKQSPADYVKEFDQSLHVFPQRDQLQQQISVKAYTEPFHCFFKDGSLKNVIPEPDLPPGCDADSSEFDFEPGTKPKLGSGDKDETVIGLLSNMSLEGLRGHWIRPHPPMLPIHDGELVWLNFGDNHELQWDYGMCLDTSRGAAVRD